MFNLLTPYAWHWDNIDRSRNTHYCFLVGYDDNDYYFVEDPTMIKKEYFVPLENNPTIGRISKEEMLKALRMFCEIMVVDVNQKKLYNINKFKEITKQIVKNYNHKSFSYDYGTVYIGREALCKIIEYIYTNKFESIKNYLENNYFFIHLLYSRRLIYKWCLEDVESEYNREYSIEIYKSIQESVNTLQTLRNLIIKHNIKPFKTFNQITNKWVKRLMKNEDILIESISKIC
jgi:hypothetical protein